MNNKRNKLINDKKNSLEYYLYLLQKKIQKKFEIWIRINLAGIGSGTTFPRSGSADRDPHFICPESYPEPLSKKWIRGSGSRSKRSGSATIVIRFGQIICTHLNIIHVPQF